MCSRVSMVCYMCIYGQTPIVFMLTERHDQAESHVRSVRGGAWCGRGSTGPEALPPTSRAEPPPANTSNDWLEAGRRPARPRLSEVDACRLLLVMS